MHCIGGQYRVTVDDDLKIADCRFRAWNRNLDVCLLMQMQNRNQTKRQFLCRFSRAGGGAVQNTHLSTIWNMLCQTRPGIESVVPSLFCQSHITLVINHISMPDNKDLSGNNRFLLHRLLSLSGFSALSISNSYPFFPPSKLPFRFWLHTVSGRLWTMNTLSGKDKSLSIAHSISIGLP